MAILLIRRTAQGQELSAHQVLKIGEPCSLTQLVQGYLCTGVCLSRRICDGKVKPHLEQETGSSVGTGLLGGCLLGADLVVAALLRPLNGIKLLSPESELTNIYK